MFIVCDCNCIFLLNDAVVTYNDNVHCTIEMTPVRASKSPEKIKYCLTSNKYEHKNSIGNYVKTVHQCRNFQKR